MTLTHTIQLLAILALAATCGCSSDHLQAIDKHQYIALENENVERFSVVQVSLATAAAAPDELDTDLVLATDAGANQTRLTVLVRKAPLWQRLEGGEATLLDYADDAARTQPSDRIHWILSLNPLIVGIGTEIDPNPRDTLGVEFFQGTVQLQGVDRLVSAADLHRTLDAICVSDPWSPTGDATPRTILLPARPTILQVLRQRPWRSPAVATTPPD